MNLNDIHHIIWWKWATSLFSNIMPRGGGRTHLCVSSWEPRLLLPGTEGAGPGPLQWKELLHLMLETYLCCTEGDFMAGTEVCLELKGK